MVLRKGALQLMQPTVLREPLHCSDRLSFQLDSKQQTGADRLTIDQDRAGAADAVLTADVGPRLPALLAKRIRQRAARLDVDDVALTVDGEIDLGQECFDGSRGPCLIQGAQSHRSGQIATISSVVTCVGKRIY